MIKTWPLCLIVRLLLASFSFAGHLRLNHTSVLLDYSKGSSTKYKRYINFALQVTRLLQPLNFEVTTSYWWLLRIELTARP